MSTEIMDKVIPYSIGIFSASVCADNGLTPTEVEKEFNRSSPAGTTNGWKLSDDTHFKQGKTNPCPCDKFPETRTHYLFNC